MQRVNKFFRQLKKLLVLSGKRQQGSALILAIIAAIILTLLGLAGLTQAGTDLIATRNFYDDKEVFYSADAGINIGINTLKTAWDPTTVVLNQPFKVESVDKKRVVSYNLRSGRAKDTSPQPVRFFNGYTPPPPSGISIEISGEIAVKVLPWLLQVTAERGNPSGRNFIQKELETVVVTLTSEY